MTATGDLEDGARNLLVNCADLKPDESLLIIREDPALGWYDQDTAVTVAAEARIMGVTPTIMDVGAPENARDRDITDAVAAHDCTIFLTRIGDGFVHVELDRLHQLCRGPVAEAIVGEDEQVGAVAVRN